VFKTIYIFAAIKDLHLSVEEEFIVLFKCNKYENSSAGKG
jgi:hypothetical protein